MHLTPRSFSRLAACFLTVSSLAACGSPGWRGTPIVDGIEPEVAEQNAAASHGTETDGEATSQPASQPTSQPTSQPSSPKARPAAGTR